MRATRLTLPSPAKLNVFLHIIGRRDDGYHKLQTLFQLLDHGDTLHFEVTETRDIELETPINTVANQDNLIVRAAKLLQQDATCSLGTRIRIDKRLPMGGGLGGGSSNAATTLLALNYLWSLDYSLDQLAELGNTLGADVPVFVLGQNAFAEGTGEILHAVNLPSQWYLVIKPQVNVETATIFSASGLTRDSLPIRIAAFFGAGSLSLSPEANAALFGDENTPNGSESSSKIGTLKNDCESIVCTMYPEVDEALNWLRAQPETQRAILTGTGACVFGRYQDEQAAKQVLQRLPARWSGFVSQSSSRSTAHESLDSLTRY